MDSICVKMPNTLSEFMLAMAIVQDMQLQIAVAVQRNQRDDYQLTIRMNEKFKYFEPVLRVVKNNIPIYDYSGWDEEQRRDFDCFVRFDSAMFDRARKVALSLDAHIIHGLNTLVGTGAQEHPVLKALQLKVNKEMTADVLIMQWDEKESKIFYDFLFNNYPQLEMVLDCRSVEEVNRFTPEEIIEYVNHFNCVIGPASTFTKVAGALKKVVFEFFSDKVNGKLYGPAGTPNYIGVIGQNTTANFLWTVWEANVWPCLEGYLHDMKSREEQVLMEQLPSTVVSVEEKSGDSQILKSEQ